jgi:hypothetical protein
MLLRYAVAPPAVEVGFLLIIVPVAATVSFTSESCNYILAVSWNVTVCF